MVIYLKELQKEKELRDKIRTGQIAVMKKDDTPQLITPPVNIGKKADFSAFTIPEPASIAPKAPKPTLPVNRTYLANKVLPTSFSDNMEFEYENAIAEGQQRRQKSIADENVQIANTALADVREMPRIASPGFEKYDMALQRLYQQKGKLGAKEAAEINGYLSELKQNKDPRAQAYITAFAEIPISTFSNRAKNFGKAVGYGAIGGIKQNVDQVAARLELETELLKNDPEYARLAMRRDLLRRGEMGDTTEELKIIDEILAAKLDKAYEEATGVTDNEWLRKANVARENASYGLTSGGKFLMDTGISAGSFGANLAVSLGNPTVALGLMAAQAGGQEGYQIGQEGGGLKQQMQGSIAAGVLEALTEKLPLDKITKAWKTQGAGGLDRFVKAYVKGAVPEGGEEFVNTIAGKIMHSAVMGTEADLNSKEWWKQTIEEALTSMAAGGITGGAIAGLPAAFRGKTINTMPEPLTNRQKELIELPIIKPQKEAFILPINGQTQSTDSQTKTEPVQVGKATTIYHPYEGQTPVMDDTVTRTTPMIGENSLNTAKMQIVEARQQAETTGKNFRSYLRDFYNKWFDSSGGMRNITVNGISFNGENYLVTLNKKAVGKVLSDKNLSPEKLAVFDVIDDIVSNGEYVGSGEYVSKNSKTRKNVTRYDYFETPVKINGQDYIVTFDVEIHPNVNTYRTHKVINSIDLKPTSSADVGPVPTAKDVTLGLSTNTIPQNENGVNSSISQDSLVNTLDKRLYSAAKTRGLSINYDESLGNDLGSYDGKAIRLNPRYLDTPEAARYIFTHEIAHDAQRRQGYADVQSYLYQDLINRGYSGQEIDAAIAQIQEDYAAAHPGERLTEDGARAEFEAKYLESLANDEKTLSRLAKENPNVFIRLWEWLEDLIAKYRGTAEERGLIELRKRFIAASRGQYIKDMPAGTQYSIIRDENGKPFVSVSDNILTGVLEKDIPRILSDIVKNKFSTWVEANGQKIGINQKTAREWRQSKNAQYLYRNDNISYNDKLRAFNHADELLQASRNYINEEAKHSREDNYINFARGNVQFRVGENGYDADIIVGLTKNGTAVLYDIVNLRSKKIKEGSHTTLDTFIVSDRRTDPSLHNITIPQRASNVKNQSMQKPENNTQKSSGDDFETLMEKARLRVRNPQQIANLPKEAASTTPALRQTPNRFAEGKESKFYESLQNQSLFDDEATQNFADTTDLKYYRGITNEKSLKEAFARLQQNGSAETFRWLGKKAKDADGIDVAEGFILMKQYQDKGDYNSMVEVAKHLKEIGTTAGQTVQAMSILGRMTPEGMLFYAQKSLDDAYQTLIRSKGKGWIEANRDKFRLTEEEVSFILANMEKASLLPEGRDKNILLAEISSLVAKKIPPSKLAQIKGLARNSMLFNPKTQIRNIAGNTFIMPANLAADFIATPIDKLISKKTGVRTVGLPSVKEPAKAAARGVYESFDDFRRDINTRQMGGDRFEIGETSVFNPAFGRNKLSRGMLKALNVLDRTTSFLLDAGDRPFFEGYFTNSLNNQMRLNKVSEPTADMIDIATQEALQRTWQDSNRYTKSVKGIRDLLNFGKEWGFGSIVLPFTKTPANLTKALVDYSPAGVVNALANDARVLVREYRKGTATPQMQKRFVDNLGKGIAGSLLMVLWGALADKGIISGSGDEDKDVANFEKNVLGIQPYSVVINGKSYTYDWAQPLAGQAAMVADFIKDIKAGKGLKDASFRNIGTVGNAILNALQMGGNTLYEQSFLSGFKTLFGYDGFTKGLVSLAMDAPTQFSPSFMRQLTQLYDDTYRQSFEYKDELGSTKNQLMAGLPIFSKQLAPQVDTLGREMKRVDNGIFNVFLNPANVKEQNTTKVGKEIYAVYQQTGEKAVLPSVAPYYVGTGEDKTSLTSHQRADWQKISGQKVENCIEQLMVKPSYKNLKKDEKAELLTDISQYAKDYANYKVVGDPISKNWKKAYEAEQKGIDLADYLMIWRYKDGNGNGGVTQEEMEKAINKYGKNLTKKQKAYLWQQQNTLWKEKNNPFR